MSDTPRTDAALAACENFNTWELSCRNMTAHARTMEREMAALKAAPTATLETAHPDRRAERLEVASRIAAGILANPDGCASNVQLVEAALNITDALIAAVDAKGVTK